jgi:hypothetical protein
MEIISLEGAITEADLNWMLAKLIRPGSAVKEISVALVPGKVLVTLTGEIPLVGNRSVRAELVSSVHEDVVHLTLTRLDIPLVPRAMVCAWVAAQAKVDYLSASGNSLVVNMPLLLDKVRLRARVTGLDVQQGIAYLTAGGAPNATYPQAE